MEHVCDLNVLLNYQLAVLYEAWPPWGPIFLRMPMTDSRNCAVPSLAVSAPTIKDDSFHLPTSVAAYSSWWKGSGEKRIVFNYKSLDLLFHLLRP